VAGLFLVGLSGGAKQILPVFLSGLCAAPLVRARFPGRVRLTLLALLAAVWGSFFWLIPLSHYAGSLREYLTWALGQVAWQRREAVAADLGGAALWKQARFTFGLIWGHVSLAWPFLALAAVGAWDALRNRREREWLVWLVAPILALRFLFLGPWMRFSIYYLPFLLVLAVCGLEVVSRYAAPASRGPETPTAVPRSMSPANRFAVIGSLFVLTWAIVQTRYILPTLVAIHRARAPMAQAMEFVAQRYQARRTLILIPESQRMVHRLAQFYVGNSGFAFELADSVQLSQLRARPTVLLLQSGEIVSGLAGWTGGAERRGSWQVDVPRWLDLSASDDPWRIDLFEVLGALVTFRNWHWVEPGIRWSEPGGSTVFISHAPGAAWALRFACGIASASPQPPAPAARFTLNHRLTYEWDGRGDVFTLSVPRDEVRNGRVRVDVQAGCTTSVTDAQGRATPVGCLYLKDVTLIEEPGD